MISLREFIENTCRLYAENKDRLGQLYVNLNCFVWDDMLGDKPPDFDFLSRSQQSELIDPYYRHIVTLLGEEEKSMYWWTIELGKTYDEWHDWYYDPETLHLDDSFRLYKMINGERCYIDNEYFF